MLKKIALAMLLASAGALPAFAQGTICTAPPMPVSVDPSKATVDQVRALLAATQGFIGASDAYESCLGNDLQAQKDQARSSSRPFDPAIEAAINAKIAANQKDKEKVGGDADIFVSAFKKTHACEGKQLNACQ